MSFKFIDYSATYFTSIIIRARISGDDSDCRYCILKATLFMTHYTSSLLFSISFRMV